MLLPQFAEFSHQLVDDESSLGFAKRSRDHQSVFNGSDVPTAVFLVGVGMFAIAAEYLYDHDAHCSYWFFCR